MVASLKYGNTSRVFIDFGQNLPGNGESTTSEQDFSMVTGIIDKNMKEHEAMFYTHAHEDHVGLFWYIPIDQYIGEGSKELLLIKYRILEEAIKKEKEQYSQQPERDFHKRIMLEMKYVSAVAHADEVREFKTWTRAEVKKAPASITIGDIKVTPFYNCHSIYDSYMFLIEADGKRIWHTGDYREHGYLGKGLFPTLKKYATNIDVLITEGTMLKREDKCIHEREVSRKMASVMQAQIRLCLGISYRYRTTGSNKRSSNKRTEAFVHLVFVHEKNDGTLYGKGIKTLARFVFL